jgi:carbohydrate-selective porin OprB
MQLTDHIAVTPGVIWLSSPGHDNGNSNTWVGAVRTTFSF